MNIDLTGVAVSLIGVVGSILAIVINAQIQSRMKDQQATAILTTAVKNSLGAIQQAADAGIRTLAPSLPIPSSMQSLAPGVQYVLDHAGDEAVRLGVTPEEIAGKIDAQIGLGKIASPASVTAPVLAGIPTPDPIGGVLSAGSK